MVCVVMNMKISSEIRLGHRHYAVIVDLGGYYKIIGVNHRDGSPFVINRIVVECYKTVDGLYIRENYPLRVAQDYINNHAIPL